MTHMDTTYNLNVTSRNPVDGSGSTLTFNTNMPDDLMRLLQLSGQDAVYTLNITQNNQAHDVGVKVNSSNCTTITTNNAQDLVQAIGGTPTKDCGCAQDCDCQQSSDFALMEQQAEYDYGHEDATEEQVEFDIKDYNFKGRADLPERLSSARFGSNPLRSEMREGKSYEQLRNMYEQFLLESDNDAGQLSPLTSDNRNEFLHDPLAGEDAVTDGSRSPLSRIERQKLPD